MARISLAATLEQPALPDLCAVTAAVNDLANAGMDERGAVFTRREVVEFILDLVGYRSDAPLHARRLLEPSFGDGDFLLPAIERLLVAWRRAGGDMSMLAGAVRAVELNRASFEHTRGKVVLLLAEQGLSHVEARAIADQWLVHGDFLLAPLDGSFDIVVGNPPYVRQELIPDALMMEYRRLYATIYDRADIYVPFIERSLQLLAKGGELGFICSDRWMKNRYGGPLRAMVSKDFHLRCYVDMVGTDAFHAEVAAYPAITIIGRTRGSITRIAHRPPVERAALGALADALLASEAPVPETGIREIRDVASGAEPWLLDDGAELALVRRLEAAYPTIEEAGCKVGIGVATGADEAFIGPFDDLDVEADRKLPLVMTRDIESGTVAWRGQGVINPFADDGGLVDLAEYPRLARYLEARRHQIAGRHVARKAPARWYRTIDRIYPALAAKPKLLIPDIKGGAHIVYEEGRLYPHHNLYFITSDIWDVRALQAVLRSGIAKLFVSAYSTKMRGGFLRFQAQYLRRIRLPLWADVAPQLRRRLVDAAEAGDVEACNEAAYELYQLTPQERLALGGS